MPSSATLTPNYSAYIDSSRRVWKLGFVGHGHSFVGSDNRVQLRLKLLLSLDIKQEIQDREAKGRRGRLLAGIPQIEDEFRERIVPEKIWL